MDTSEPPETSSWSEPEGWDPPATSAPERPTSILQAMRLMYVGAGLSVVGIILTFLQKDEIRDMLRDADESLSPDELDSQVAGALTIGALVGLIGVGLWIWMAQTNGQGKAWARTVASVLGGLNLLGFIVNVLLGQYTALGLVLGVINAAVAIAILVLLYRPDSNRYYDQVSASNAGS